MSGAEYLLWEKISSVRQDRVKACYLDRLIMDSFFFRIILVQFVSERKLICRQAPDSMTENMMDITDREFRLMRELFSIRFGINLTDKKRSLLVARLQSLIRSSGYRSFRDYYEHLVNDSSEQELGELIDRISTNYTYFYREKDHFEYYFNTVLPALARRIRRGKSRSLRIWCAGCSTGEEPYMLLMLLHEFLGPEYRDWDAEILATDISERALDMARAGIYPDDRLRELPAILKKKYFIRQVDGNWAVVDSVKNDSVFRRLNLMNNAFPFYEPFHIIFCRNVMIYFDQETRDTLVRKFHHFLVPRGYLFVGHSETLGPVRIFFKYLKPAVYQKETRPEPAVKPVDTKIRVLVVDDSALIRQILRQGLSLDPEIEVVGTAADPYIARDQIIELKPDVLTLDVEMPRMNGVEFLRRLMPQYPLPVIMVSSMTQMGKRVTIDALEAGAVDFVSKPTANVTSSMQDMLKELRVKIKIASTANVSHWKNMPVARLIETSVGERQILADAADKIICIGASTGGTEAIIKVVSRFPVTMPGVVIVQHMPAGFTKMFAERLKTLCAMEVKEAESGDRVMPGRILVAPGDLHMKLERSGGIYQVVCANGEKVSGHRPSVDVLMNSVAGCAGAKAIGIILTGMGSDGAEGMAAMRRAGARNIAQDEATSVVFGMPAVAFERGGVERLVALDDIAAETIKILSEM